MLKKSTFFRWLMALAVGLFLSSSAMVNAQDYPDPVDFVIAAEMSPAQVLLQWGFNAANFTPDPYPFNTEGLSQQQIDKSWNAFKQEHKILDNQSSNNGRAVVGYQVWRERVYLPGTMQFLGTTSQTQFVDFAWGAQEWGVYKWYVVAVYAEGESTPTGSNTLDKLMNTSVTVQAQTNSGDSPAGTLVEFTNISEPDLELVYSAVLPGSGMFTKDDFRRGVYNITVDLPGFEALSFSNVQIVDVTSFNWLLLEILAPPVDLYVTPTAYATWAAGTAVPFQPFFEDFNEGIPSDWTIEHGPNATATQNWFRFVNTAARPLTGTPYMIADSDGAGSGAGRLHSLLTSAAIDASNAGTLYLEFDQYYRHLGAAAYGRVEVYDGSDWITVLNQTVTSGTWTVPNHRVIDVTEYANANFKVRFNYDDGGSWAWYWALDNVSVSDVPSRKIGRGFEHYKVFLNNVLVTETFVEEYQFGTNGEVLVDGQTYLAEVAAVYSTGQSEKTAYTFTYIACGNYAVPGSFTAAQVIGTTNVALNWTVPGIPPGEDQIAFARLSRNGEVIAEFMGNSYLDTGLALGTYNYCITFVYESGAETCPGVVCASATVTGNANVNGTVFQALYLGGAPIEGATITLSNANNTFSFTTNAAGAYSGQVIGGTYNYEVAAQGYITQTLTGISVPSAGTVTRNFVMMEFPVEPWDVMAVELSSSTVEVSWRSPQDRFIPYFEDFEADNGGWVSGAISGVDHWQWGTPAQTNVSHAYSGTKAWGVRLAANYDNNANTWLMRQFDFSKAQNPYFSVQILMHTEPGWDGMILEYSLNDGASWLKVMGEPGFYNNTSTFGPLPPPKWSGRFQAYQLFGTSMPEVAGESNVWLRFRFASDGSVQDEGLAIDDVSIIDMPRSTAATESTLEGYRVYRTSCAEGGNLQFLGFTLDTLFNDNTWGTAASGVYRWGVQAVYAENMSETAFSNCLDKNMSTFVSVTVQTNSGDSPEGTSVLFVNTSEPDLELTYSAELDASGYFLWDDFRKGTYDIFVELAGFAPLELTDVVIDIPFNFSWILQELLLPIMDLYVTPTGYATWKSGGDLGFQTYFEDFEASDGGWISGAVSGADHWQWGVPAQTNVNQAHSGTKVWMTRLNANYDNNANTWLARQFDFSAAVNPHFSVHLLMHIETGWDGMILEYSLDDGASWLKVMGDPGFYNNTSTFGPLAPPKWSGRFPGAYLYFETFIPEVAGQANAWLRFRFASDGSVQDEGVAIDDITIMDMPVTRELLNYTVYLDGVAKGTTTDEFYQYDTTELVEGQTYLSEVAANYTTGVSAKMAYEWTYFSCENFPGPDELTAEVQNVSNVVLNWSGTTPPPPGGDWYELKYHNNVPADAYFQQYNYGYGVVYNLSGYSNVTVEKIDFRHSPWGINGTWNYKLHIVDWDTYTLIHTTPVLQSTLNNGWELDIPVGSLPQSGLVGIFLEPMGNSPTDAYPCIDGDAASTTSSFFGALPNWQGMASAGPVGNFLMDLWILADPQTGQRQLVKAPVLEANGTEVIASRNPNHMATMATKVVAEKAEVNATDVPITPTGRKELGANSRDLLFDNGPLVNGPGQGFGGADASILQSNIGMSTYGAGIQHNLGNHMADDFVVDETWTVESFTFYGYQTGSTTTSSFTGGYMQIFDGPPNAGGTVVWGDMTTNRMASTAFTNIYRSLATDVLNSQRPIMQVVCATPGLILEPGTYWVEFSFTGSLASGPWAPPITINGQTTTGNSLQNLAGTWQPFLDGGTMTPQGLPFLVHGTSGGGGGGGGGTDWEYLGANIYRNGVLIAEKVQGETYTDAGVEPGYYDYCVTFVYEQEAESCPGLACVYDVLVTEDCVAPVNLSANNPTEGQPGPQQVDLIWNEMVAQEFRYDDGVRTAQLGFNGGTINSVLGAKHSVSATLTEMSWLLSDAADGGGPHATVQVYVFGLTGAGLPDGSNVLYTASVSNTDGVWNTHTFPNPINATTGFFLAVGYNGFAGLGTDDGVGAPWVFVPNTHYFAVDYNAGGWATWESAGFSVNAMIRAMGMPNAVASTVVEGNDFGAGEYIKNVDIYLEYRTLAEAAAYSEPTWTQEPYYAPRAFMGYNIYYRIGSTGNFSVLESLWPETSYSYIEARAGEFHYYVVAEYEFCGESDPSNTVIVPIITSLDEKDIANATRLYPNPANNSLFIEAPDMQRITIVNALGQVVYDAEANNQSKISLNTASYEAGVYVVRIATAEGMVTKRLSIVR